MTCRTFWGLTSLAKPVTASRSSRNADYYATLGGCLEDHLQRLACHRAARPACLAQHMVVARAQPATEPHHPHGVTHHALAGREHRAAPTHFPGAVKEGMQGCDERNESQRDERRRRRRGRWGGCTYIILEASQSDISTIRLSPSPRHLESGTIASLRRTVAGKFRYETPLAEDELLQRVEPFHFPMACLRRTAPPRVLTFPCQYGRTDCAHVAGGAMIAAMLPWSSWMETWAPTGPSGPNVLPLE